MKIVRENHYGQDVWVNQFTERFRKEECLCLHCDILKECSYAKRLYETCVAGDIALAVTRCKHYTSNYTKSYLNSHE
jgi:hypothetical protein